jgi:hypothetical protein
MRVRPGRSVAVCSLSLLLLACGGGGGGEVSPPPPPKAWSPAETIGSPLPDSADTAQVAVDSQGVAYAVWQHVQGGFQHVEANRFVPGRGWDNSTILENATGNSNRPSVAAGGDGHAFIAWGEASGGIRDDLYASRFDPVRSAWENGVLVENNDLDSVQRPLAAVDSGGTAHVVWKQNDGVSRFRLYANRSLPGTGWNTANVQAIDAGTEDVDSGWALAAAPSGAVFAVWEQTDGLNSRIVANRFVPGTGWTGPAVLDNASSFAPDVAAYGLGGAFAVWKRLGVSAMHVWASRFDPGSGTWELPTPLETSPAGDASNPQVAAGAAGNAVAVWQQPEPAGRLRIYAASFSPGGGWGAATLVDRNNDGDSDLPKAGVDAGGNAVAVWEQLDNSAVMKVWANRYIAGSGWQTPARIGSSGAGAAQNPVVAVDPAGNAVAVWEEFDGTRFRIRASTLR